MINEKNDDYLSAVLFPLCLGHEKRVFSPDYDFDEFKSEQEMAKNRIQMAEQQCIAQLDDMRTQARQQAYQEGLKHSCEKVSSTLQSIESFANSHEQQVGNLVIACVKKICGELPTTVLMSAMVKNALSDYIDATAITLHVHPDIAAFLSKENFNNIHIEENADMELTDVKIETPDHIRDIGLSQQITALEKTLS